MNTIGTTPGSHDAARTGVADRRGKRLLRAAWWSFALLPVSFVGATVLGGVILAALGHDPDGETDPSFWQAVVAGIPSLVVMVLPCALVVGLGHRAASAGLEQGREAVKAGLVVGGALILANLIPLVLRLV